MKTITLNNNTVVSVNQLVKRLKEIEYDIYAFESTLKTHTYTQDYHYNKAFDVDGNRYASYLKNLRSNMINNKKQIVICDQLIEYILNKYNLTPVAVSDLTNKRYRDFILKMIEEGKAEHKVDVISQLMTM